MDLQLKDRRAVVTGGSKGIGKAIARVLAAEGCDVALVARGLEDLEAAAQELAEATGRNVIGLHADTGDDASVTALALDVSRELGGVDILVNCAATPNTGALTDDQLEDEINVKVRGYMRCARAFAPGMAENGWGRIINIAGNAARRTGSITGSVRNVAVAAMTKNLADELGPQGINVTVVHPGMTVTEKTSATLATIAARKGVSKEAAEQELAASVSIGRLVTAGEVAHVVAFLASPLSVALNGDPVLASGGQKGTIYY